MSTETETESLQILAPEGWTQGNRNTIELQNENGRVWIYRYPDGNCAGRYCTAVYRKDFDMSRLFDDLGAAIFWSVEYLNTDLSNYKSAIADQLMEELTPRIDQLVKLGQAHRIDGYGKGYKAGRIDALKSIKGSIDTMIDWNIEEIAA